MEYRFFPDSQPCDPQKGDFSDESGDVGKEIKNLSKHNQALFLRVNTFLKALQKVNDLTPFLQNEQIFKFPKEYDDLYEMRIPKQARGGVFRIYFCKSLKALNTLILLCAELKHKAKPMKLKVAMEKLKQYKEYVKQGVMLWKKIKS